MSDLKENELQKPPAKQSSASAFCTPASQLRYWLAFSKIYSIGTIRLRKLLEYFDSIKDSWHAAPADLQQIEGFSPKIIEKFIAERNSIGDLNKLEETILSKDIQIVTMNDENYPFYLKQIYDPPIVLYIKGNLNNFNQEKSLAIVGSRRSSDYIKSILKKIISELKGQDITIVSGMAVGVDSCAHQTALDNGLNTIAVIGSGFDNIYPKQNRILYKNIVNSGGAVISEYFPDQKAELWTFPRRNRIISGLSQGTLVGEAGLKSGALITAKLCLDQNRELMCIPGMIQSPNAEGTYKLIKEGAAVITKAEDIFHQLGWETINPYSNTVIPHLMRDLFGSELLQESQNGQMPCLTRHDSCSNEQKIYKLLELEPKSFDTILHETKMNIDELMMALTSLELEGVIKQLPGQMFVKNLHN